LTFNGLRGVIILYIYIILMWMEYLNCYQVECPRSALQIVANMKTKWTRRCHFIFCFVWFVFTA
jgi:hypothetical protein